MNHVGADGDRRRKHAHSFGAAVPSLVSDSPQDQVVPRESVQPLRRGLTVRADEPVVAIEHRDGADLRRFLALGRGVGGESALPRECRALAVEDAGRRHRFVKPAYLLDRKRHVAHRISDRIENLERIRRHRREATRRSS